MSRRSGDDLDEIGAWSQKKHVMLEYYASPFTSITKQFTTVYIDAYANRGKARLKGTNEAVLGSALRALSVKPPFDRYVFIEIDPRRAADLRANVGERPNVEIIVGDANDVIPARINDLVSYDRYERALAFLDPYKMKELQWPTIAALGGNRAVDAIIFFPMMDAHRSVLLRDPAKAKPGMLEKMRAFCGADDWRPVVYNSTNMLDFGDDMVAKQDEGALLKWFADRLRSTAGFAEVSRPIPVRNTSNNVIYDLFFASHSRAAKRIIRPMERVFDALL